MHPPPARKLGDASGSVEPHDENCRQSQALCTPLHENCGASQAVCSPMMKIADSLRLCEPQFTKIARRLRLFAPPSRNRRQSKALGTFCALHSPKLRGVSGFLRPHGENCRQSQALCASPSRKLRDVSGSVQPRAENCRQSQALRTPPHEIWGRLRLCAAL